MPNQEKALIVLQENTGQISLPPNLPVPLATAVRRVIDAVAETFEEIKTSLQGNGRYAQVVLLTDVLCTRVQLLRGLIEQTRRGRVIDLVVLGHGWNEHLQLHNETLTNSTIRSLLSEARRTVNDDAFKFNLRMVYMCNCHGSTLNDDWLAIGAAAAVGSQQNDYMPEPMTTFFIHNWMDGQPVQQAANNAYRATIPFYTVVYPPTLRLKMKTVSQDVPHLDTSVFPPRLRTRTISVEVPDGVDIIPHPYINETELLVGGDRALRF